MTSRLHTTDQDVTKALAECKKVLGGSRGFKLQKRVDHQQVDVSSAANTSEVRTEHISIVWTVRFPLKILDGYVELHIEVLSDDAHQLILDTRHLNVRRVSHINRTAGGHNARLQWAYGDEDEVVGKPLLITLPTELQQAGAKATIRVTYETTPESTALQWLNATQTADKHHPYLLSQCEAIHARSLLPCQDSPVNKVTYNARVSVQGDFKVLMSAVRKEHSDQMGLHTFTFVQAVPIPTYLITIAVGHLECRKIGPRSHVWAEPSVVDAAAYEFADTEEMIAAGEAIVGPYVWGQYDILCLPPSFPFGGMENPCLTFVTPTLLAGDRSLAAVIIHEITHSWTGNLVTNNTWTDFWLNEGCTMFIQRKIMARLYGEKVAQLDAVTGVEGLQDTIDTFGKDNPLTELQPNLDGVDPDDAFSRVPYEKGFNFLYYLQSLATSVDDFMVFFNKYLKTFAFQTATTEAFIEMYTAAFPDAAQKVDWEAWLHKPGMPPVANAFDNSLGKAAVKLANAWVSGGPVAKGAYEGFTTAQRIAFFNKLLTIADELAPKESISADVLRQMDAAYGLTKAGNSEIKFRWQRLCLRCGVTEIVPHVTKFLKDQGRNKFIRPLYRELMRVPYGRKAALSTFDEHKPQYHPISSRGVARDLEAEAEKDPVAPGTPVGGKVEFVDASEIAGGDDNDSDDDAFEVTKTDATATALQPPVAGAGAGAGAGVTAGAGVEPVATAGAIVPTPATAAEPKPQAAPVAASAAPAAAPAPAAAVATKESPASSSASTLLKIAVPVVLVAGVAAFLLLRRK